MTTYNPGDLLIFSDGRRRCVCEVHRELVYGSEADFNERVWYCNMSEPIDRAWHLLPTGWRRDHSVVVIPNVFQPEEYLRNPTERKLYEQ